MNLLKTFETERRKLETIPIFFHSRGYKIQSKTPESYTFKRGANWGSLYSLDPRKWATRVEVGLKKLGNDRVRVNVSYHIQTKAIETPFHRSKIISEMEALESFVATPGKTVSAKRRQADTARTLHQ